MLAEANVNKVNGGTYVASVDTRDGDERAGRAATTVGNLNLSTGEVELSTAVRLGDVQRNGFHADKVSILRLALINYPEVRMLLTAQREAP